MSGVSPTRCSVRLVDDSLPDLPEGYLIERLKDGLFSGRLVLRPGSDVFGTLDTARNRLVLVWIAWSEYADKRNAT